jgi:uncharacterized small protein (DUF1192 family)
MAARRSSDCSLQREINRAANILPMSKDLKGIGLHKDPDALEHLRAYGELYELRRKRERALQMPQDLHLFSDYVAKLDERIAVAEAILQTTGDRLDAKLGYLTAASLFDKLKAAVIGFLRQREYDQLNRDLLWQRLGCAYCKYDYANGEDWAEGKDRWCKKFAEPPPLFQGECAKFVEIEPDMDAPEYEDR